MTTSTSTAAGNTQHGNDAADARDRKAVRAWDLDAIGHRYDMAKADIADGLEVWPETEAIDLRAIAPPPASRRASPQPAPTVPERLRRAWKRWSSARTGHTR